MCELITKEVKNCDDNLVTDNMKIPLMHTEKMLFLKSKLERCTWGTWRKAHIGQQGTSIDLSEDAKQSRLDRSSGQTLQYVAGYEDVLK